MRFANSVISSLFFISNSITVRAAILVIFSLTDKYIDSFYINSTLYHTDQTLVRQSPLLGKSYPDSRSILGNQYFRIYLGRVVLRTSHVEILLLPVYDHPKGLPYFRGVHVGGDASCTRIK